MDGKSRGCEPPGQSGARTAHRRADLGAHHCARVGRRAGPGQVGLARHRLQPLLAIQVRQCRCHRHARLPPPQSQARPALAADAAVNLDRVLVTVCDADARLDARYLSALTYRYLEEPDAEYVLYQPVVLFHANIRRLPLPLRVLNSMYSVMQLSRMV